MRIIKERLRLRCNLISITDHIRFISFRIFFHMKRTDYYHIYNLQFTIYTVGCDFNYYTSCECLRRVWSIVLPFQYSAFCLWQTYSRFFSTHFFTSDWLAMDEVARNSHLILFTFILNVLHSKLSYGNSSRGKNERISVFLLLLKQCEMRKIMQKNMIVSNLFNNFAYFVFEIFFAVATIVSDSIVHSVHVLFILCRWKSKRTGSTAAKSRIFFKWNTFFYSFSPVMFWLVRFFCLLFFTWINEYEMVNKWK